MTAGEARGSLHGFLFLGSRLPFHKRDGLLQHDGPRSLCLHGLLGDLMLSHEDAIPVQTRAVAGEPEVAQEANEDHHGDDEGPGDTDPATQLAQGERESTDDD